ncbi:Uncharacterised protein [Moraxella lacunata]|uniref:PIN domain-containing protein n=3 Tax=Moraxella TaxID=475 RepID=A0A378QTD5_9GAMM|nr:hypothetical protein [Moraxella lacunata]STZ04038.1 Uncharacterised protein [Moraxella equi]STZ63115.1 Uncharacterised protein [Moraxella lacunata]
MIMADNNFLIALVADKQKYRLLLQQLERQNHKIGLPTPVLAEFMVRDNNMERELFLTTNHSFIQEFDFDKKSAIVSANIMRELLKTDFFKNKSKDKQIIKVDIQILGITIANGVKKLFSADIEIARIIDMLELPIELVNFDENDGLEQSDLFGTVC